MKKNRILFVYHRMCIGGSTTSLLSLLHNLDPSKFEIDLLLYEKKGVFLTDIPKHVNILNQAKKINLFSLIRFLFNIKTFKAIFCKLFRKNTLYHMQYMGQSRVNLCRKIENKYDIAIGFLECLPSYYTLSEKINATKKIIWIHTDYINAKFSSKIDEKVFLKANNIVLVSKGCLDSFNSVFKNLTDKTILIENIFSKKMLKLKSNLYNPQIKKNDVNFLVVCRMDVKVKALDRLLEVFRKLINNDITNFHCSFVGDDVNNEFQKLLTNYSDLCDNISYLGATSNPYPYFLQADCLLLLSLYEGKPMVVIEAQLLNLPTLITNFNSASEIVNNGYDGLIFENNFDDIYEGLLYVLKNSYILGEFKTSLYKKDLSKYMKIESVIEKLNL